MQAAFQKNVDMSISKTINLPNSATKEEIRQIIFDAWKSGCKGLTIYRNGSRENEVLSLKKPVVEDKIMDWIETENAFYESKTPAVIYKVHSGCGKFYVIIGHDKEEPTMIFVEGDGVGGCNANMAAMGRSISAGLEWGTPAENYVKQFSKVKCMTAMNNKLSCGKSCADITGKCMGDAIKMLQPVKLAVEANEEKCCDNPHYVMEGGCRICTNCGKSKCS
jgi:ribonucleoside-diphosphate reductase alpha chain